MALFRVNPVKPQFCPKIRILCLTPVAYENSSHFHSHRGKEGKHMIMNRLSHLNRTASLGVLVFAMHSAPAMAQNGQNEGEEIKEGNRNSGRQDVVGTAMSTYLQ